MHFKFSMDQNSTEMFQCCRKFEIVRLDEFEWKFPARQKYFQSYRRSISMQVPGNFCQPFFYGVISLNLLKILELCKTTSFRTFNTKITTNFRTFNKKKLLALEHLIASHGFQSFQSTMKILVLVQEQVQSVNNYRFLVRQCKPSHSISLVQTFAQRNASRFVDLCIDDSMIRNKILIILKNIAAD